MRWIMGLAAAMALSGCGSEASGPSTSEASSSSSAAEAPQIKPWLKPEDIVRFPQSMVACMKRDDLQEVMALGLSGHSTKMKAYFSPDSDGGLRCVMLPTTKKFKIIDAEANNPNMPDALIVELVGADVDQAEHGAFAVVLDKSMAEVAK
ncbi:hypothetical protein [Novosphingobium sp.]|uniref:hypothetical protein n=1 Tax=Novosphingobium sp. TaxID=1874826 RepID=UPI0031DB6D99